MGSICMKLIDMINQRAPDDDAQKRFIFDSKLNQIVAEQGMIKHTDILYELYLAQEDVLVLHSLIAELREYNELLRARIQHVETCHGCS